MWSFWRQTWLLMRKNWILKKRSLRGTITEIVTPVLLVLLLVIVYSQIDEETVNTEQFVLERESDARLHKHNQAVAPFAFTPFRLAAINAEIALVPGTNEVSKEDIENFQKEMDKRYPGLSLKPEDFLSPGQPVLDELPEVLNVPKFSEISKVWESQEQLEDFIESDDYASSPGDRIIFAAIAFNKVGGTWDYSIRMNISATPNTVENVDVLQRDVETERQRDYLRASSPFDDVGGAVLVQRLRIPGFLTLQLLVDRYIIGRQISEDKLPDEFFLRLFKEELGETVLGSSSLVDEILFDFSKDATSQIRNFLRGETYLPQRARMTPFPIVGFTSNLFYEIAANVFPLFLLISFLSPTSALIRGIVQEKENRIREGMQMMGLSTSALYASWFITYAIIFSFIAVLISLISNATFFPNSLFSSLFLMFLMFGISTTAFCFMISVFFSRAKTGSTIGVLLYFAAFFPFWTVGDVESSASEKTAASLLTPTAFALTLDKVSQFEDRGQGVRLGDNDTLEFRNYSYSIGIGMMVVNTIIYLVIAWYFDSVWPREYGVHQAPYFFLLPKYWRSVCGRSQRRAPTSVDTSDTPTTNDIAENNPRVEKLRADELAKEQANKAIRIKKLRKVFDTGSEAKIAVDDLSVNVHEGEIFVLLGHNGAGKSTTISMLTGLLAPTSGKIHIYDEDVSEDLSAIRSYLGVCPQHDVLWEDLTVKEHLELYAGLKGVEKSQVNDSVSDIIKNVGLTEKVNTQSKQLSGGQKRKLSVAIALLGDSKVVILDEPTSGMDPYSRRSTWDIIRNARRNRIVLLTTHFMDEADLLGDRISILANGKLKCCGSSMFLKRKYGVGYLLTTVKKNSRSSHGRLLSMVKEHIPDVEIQSEVGTELIMRLPMHASSGFPELLSKLDANLSDFGLETYGLSATTLEEVFLQVARDEDPDDNELGDKMPERHGTCSSNETNGTDACLLSSDGDGSSTEHNSAEHNGFSIEEVRAHARKVADDSFQRHFIALFMKRFHYYKRDAKAACFQLVIPILAVIFGLLIIRSGIPTNFPSYQMSSAKLNIQPDGSVLKNSVPHTAFLPNEEGRFSHLNRFTEILENVPERNASFLKYDIGDALSQPDFFSFYQDLDLGPDTSDLEVYGALVNFSTDLLHTRNDDEASKYGAFSPVVDLINASMHFQENDTLEYLIQQNTTAFHACPIFMNMINSAIYGEQKILTRNHPLPFTGRQRTIISGIESFFAALLLVIAFAFIPASYAIFIVKEREIAAKHQQLISGVSIAAYWVSTFVWDFTSYLLPMFGSIFMIYLFNVEEFTSTEDDRLATLFLLFLCYGSSVSGQTYIITYFFKHYSSAQNFVLFVNLISMILVLASFIMSQVDATCDVNQNLEYIFLFFPGYALGNGLVDLSFLSVIRQLNECDDDDPVDNGENGHGDEGFETPEPVTGLQSIAARNNVIYMAILSVGYFAIAVGIDYFLARPDLVQKLSPKPKPLNETPLTAEDIDPDVRREAERCDAQGSEYSPSDDVILLQHLRKVYKGGKVAVRDISFGVPAGEVFGFLGINGAGKTTTLKMLTGDVLPTSGCGRLAGYDIVSEQSHLRTLLGYCPQFEALLELLTVREHLELFSRIKAIPKDRVERVVNEKLQQLGLVEFENKRADEPSTGMDPVTRRRMWDVISDIATRRQEASIILTTHSMEECEALATRVGIMVGGRLRCLGSIQHIKNTQAQGYQLRIKLGSATERAVEDVINAITDRVGGSSTAHSETRVAESNLENICQALGDPEMYAQINPNGTGWMIYASVSGSEDRSTSAKEFAQWWAEEQQFKAVLSFVLETFRESQLFEQQGTLLNFKMPPQEMPLAAMFAKLEEAKSTLGIQEYALSQTSLEQVFNFFAAQQEEERNVAHGLRRVSQYSSGNPSVPPLQ